MDQTPEDAEYERALAALSGLISGRQRKDSGMWSHAFEMMQSYLEASGLIAGCGGRSRLCGCCLAAFFGRLASATIIKSTLMIADNACPPVRPTRTCLPPPLPPLPASVASSLPHAVLAPSLQRLGLDKELPRLSVIHVAGTKGKGSTCAMIERMLREAGYRTGLFTSPHLIDVRERIRING